MRDKGMRNVHEHAREHERTEDGQEAQNTARGGLDDPLPIPLLAPSSQASSRNVRAGSPVAWMWPSSPPPPPLERQSRLRCRSSSNWIVPASTLRSVLCGGGGGWRESESRSRRLKSRKGHSQKRRECCLCAAPAAAAAAVAGVVNRT